ncbi:hypothetical protein A3H75_01160 [Candidatus Uhrbacteria bacterium RIFCSPLOWO2_02_FULL_51_9]|uniref:Pyrrolo-quinoline quinone repeat domain-containing protein n=1 Tax=Candidatus Uhrbacteria bacterium RIFCSPLOWO2_02_FULL_51_9 TaxID=1802410 RepID=A0A1F7VG52_9BACT|nr:MAG: hypothetical protein A3H75_01160 [Candidatus Uhrbacteria bacterium RIFCSPLOWO2_02_FULL_51_9]
MTQKNKWWLVLVLVLGISVVALTVVYFVYVKKPVETGERSIFNPEIPINEYWDWGTINNLHLYINNTDKSVIYALDDTGKIVWTVWGRDYGIGRFEIFKTQDKLLIKSFISDELKTIWDILWVFDGGGRLKWKHSFKGYLDMPQRLVTTENNLILENRSDNQCNAGCGVICKEDLKNYCRETQTWAFNLDTGKIVWRNNTPNYYGHYLSLKDGKIVARSGGVGSGRLVHEYVVGSKTGVIESQKVSIDDGEYNQDKENTLIFDLNARKISLHKRGTDTVRWSLNGQSFLYNWVYENLNGNYKTVILDEIIFSYGGNKDDETKVLAFDKGNGELLWQGQYDTSDLGISPLKIITKDGVLLFNVSYASKSNIWAVDSRTGVILWKKVNLWFSGIDENNLIIANSYKTNKTTKVVKLELKTGEEVRE